MKGTGHMALPDDTGGMNERHDMAVKKIPGDAVGNIPPLLGKVVLAAFAMSVCQIIVAPIYVALSGNRFALVPWMCVMVALAVSFCAILGFILFWVSEIIAVRISPRFVPLMCAAIGLVSFGVWGGTVVSAVFNSLLGPLGVAALSGLNAWAVIINCAVIGAVGFAIGQSFYKRTMTRWVPLVVLMVLELLVTAVGVFYLTQMYAFLY